MTLVRQCGTPSCATSAQERTGYMVVMHLSWNTDKPISPLDSKMTHVRQCGTPSCATNAQERTGYSCPQLRTPAPRSMHVMEHRLLRRPQLRTAPRSMHVMEHTGYIALPSAAHSGAQKHSHVMVPLAARQAPKSIPAVSCPQLRTPAPRSTAMSWYPLLRDQREHTGLHCAALSCAQRRPEAQPCHGTPSCATSAQERTGHIMNSNIHAAVHQAVWQLFPLHVIQSTACVSHV